MLLSLWCQKWPLTHRQTEMDQIMREVFIFISIFYYFLSQYFLFLRSVSISGTYPRQSVAVLTKKYLHSTYLKDMKGLLDYVIYYTRQKHVVGYKRVQTVVLDALCQTFQEKTHHFFTHPLFLKLDKYVLYQGKQCLHVIAGNLPITSLLFPQPRRPAETEKIFQV